MTFGEDQIEVREVRGAAELRACQALQRRTWGITEDGYVIPVATMAGAQRVGGAVLGAYVGGRLAGFSFAFLGRLHDRPVLYSQLTAVEPELQGQGIGRRLKNRQRQVAAARGAQAVVWAFDPLQARNAAFNLAVLGATSHTYEVDLYGSRTDRLNAGLDTDRLLVEWPLAAEGGRDDHRDGPGLIEAVSDAGSGLRRPVSVRTGALEAARLLLEVPADLAVVKAAGDGQLARDWQQLVRAAFQAAFAAGLVAVGFRRGAWPAYILERAA